MFDFHTCPPESPAGQNPNLSEYIQILSNATKFYVQLSPFRYVTCGYGNTDDPAIPIDFDMGIDCLSAPFNRYQKIFEKGTNETYDEFWTRVFLGGVFGDGSDPNCNEDGCMIGAFPAGSSTSWVRVKWEPGYQNP